MYYIRMKKSNIGEIQKGSLPMYPKVSPQIHGMQHTNIRKIMTSLLYLKAASAFWKKNPVMYDRGT